MRGKPTDELASALSGYAKAYDKKAVDDFCKASTIFKSMEAYASQGELKDVKERFINLVKNADNLSEVLSIIVGFKPPSLTKENSSTVTAIFSFFKEFVEPNPDKAFLASMQKLQDEVLEYAHKNQLSLALVK